VKDFAHLIKELDRTNKVNPKVNALAEYFIKASDRDKVWTIALLSHRRPPRPVNTTLLREWAAEEAQIDPWLFEESYHIVGDLAETIALVLPNPSETTSKSLTDFLEEMIVLKGLEEGEKRDYLRTNWKTLDYYERFVFCKLITGGFRIGVSQKLMTRALSKATGVEEDMLAYRLMGNWDPKTVGFKELVLEPREEDQLSKPYPFFLAHAVEDDFFKEEDPKNWSAEHKWDGIRAQLIFRKGKHFLWSRGEELVTDKYPEFELLLDHLPDGTVLDGELLPYPDGQIGDFSLLQKRIGRKQLTKKILESCPVILKAYDLLEDRGEDLREMPLQERQKRLKELLSSLPEDLPLQLSPPYSFEHWEEAAKERERAREMRSEGLMLKRVDSPYRVGRKKGDWWKWKVDPFSIDAVLTYAMRGHGRRSNLFTDYTFALWGNPKEGGAPELLTFAKAYSGLSDAEFREVDRWIKQHTLERFGPVRSVEPQLVFEIAFEGIALSSRHKSGVATRFPRIARWRKDKKPEEANTLEDLKKLLPSNSQKTES
jgi:DNA ligase-1